MQIPEIDTCGQELSLSPLSPSRQNAGNPPSGCMDRASHPSTVLEATAVQGPTTATISHDQSGRPGRSAMGSAGSVPPADASGGQALISCPLPIALQGIDTLHLTLQLDIPAELIARMKRRKEEIQATSDDCAFLPFGETTLFSWNLQRTGTRHWPYVLKCGDVTLSLSSRASTAAIPSAQLQIGSISCNNGLDALLTSFNMWMHHHGIVYKGEKVSRIDLFVDTTLALVDQSMSNQELHITRAEKFAAYFANRKLSGVQVGSGSILFRCYDKLMEMKDKQATHKEMFFAEKWGGRPESVTRAEFQLRREAIKSFCPGESDYQSLKKMIPSIWKYLTTEWFRQAAKAVDRRNRHQDKAAISAFWSIIQQAHQAPPQDAATRNKKQKTINVKSLVDQAAGLMLTVCAAIGHAHDDFFGILASARSTIQDRLSTIMVDAGFEHDFNSRAALAKVTF